MKVEDTDMKKIGPFTVKTIVEGVCMLLISILMVTVMYLYKNELLNPASLAITYVVFIFLIVGTILCLTHIPKWQSKKAFNLSDELLQDVDVFWCDTSTSNGKNSWVDDEKLNAIFTSNGRNYLFRSSDFSKIKAIKDKVNDT